MNTQIGLQIGVRLILTILSVYNSQTAQDTDQPESAVAPEHLLLRVSKQAEKPKQKAKLIDK